MTQERYASKRQVSIVLSEGIFRQARLLTTDLSQTVEQLLIGHIEQATIPKPNRQSEIDRHVEASNAFVARHGTLADDFSTL